MFGDSAAYQKKQVRIWFVQNDLSYRKLARRVGISGPYLHQVLTGTKPMPAGIRCRLIEAGVPAELLPAEERQAA